MLKVLADSGVKQVGWSRNWVKTKEALGNKEEQDCLQVGPGSTSDASLPNGGLCAMKPRGAVWCSCA